DPGVGPRGPGGRRVAVEATPQLVVVESQAQPLRGCPRRLGMAGRLVPGRAVGIARQPQFAPVPGFVPADGRHAAVTRAEGVGEKGLVGPVPQPGLEPNDGPITISPEGMDNSGVGRVAQGPVGYRELGQARAGPEGPGMMAVAVPPGDRRMARGTTGR